MSLLGFLVSLGCDVVDEGDAGLDAVAPARGKADGGATPTTVLRWDSPTNVFPAQIDYAVDGDYDANHCELFLNAVGDGSFTNGGFSHRWLEAYVSVPPQSGDVLNVGMFVATGSADSGNFILLADEIEPDYWRTGFTFESNVVSSHNHEVESFAFFVDVERPDGEVARLWQSGGGQNYRPEDAFALATFDHSIGGGTVRYANEASTVFDQKHACS
jgi:hypothetical protein